MRARGGSVVVGLGALVVLAGCASGTVTRATGDDSGVPLTATPVHPPTVSPSSPSAAGTASPATSMAAAASAVGALFPSGTDSPHSCSATAVASASGDVVMTAAHCVSGDGLGLVFVPGYDAGRAPFGAWMVTGAYAPSGWVHDTAEDDDVAFLTVAPHMAAGVTTTLQQAVGGVQVGSTPSDGDAVTVTAYNIGIDDQPVRCTTTVRDTAEQPTLDCHGFSGGSSGAAWLSSDGDVVSAVGIIGGRHQGGCVDYTSYSPPFGDDVTATLQRAGTATGGSDSLPDPPDDGC